VFTCRHAKSCGPVGGRQKQQPHQRAIHPAAGAENEVKLPALSKPVLARIAESYPQLDRQPLPALASPVPQDTPAARRTGALKETKPSLSSSIVWLEGLFHVRHLLLQLSYTIVPPVKNQPGYYSIPGNRQQVRNARRP
jgi:hypothetical protein